MDALVNAGVRYRMAVVNLTAAAVGQFDQLPRPIRGRMLRLFERLEDWPDVSGAKPLTGDLAGCWRMRTGDYRRQFRVAGETVFVETIGHRDRFYD